MSRAAKSLIFAGEDSEGEESDDDEWLDDVEDTLGGNEDADGDAASFLGESPAGTPRASANEGGVGGVAGVGTNSDPRMSPARTKPTIHAKSEGHVAGTNDTTVTGSTSDAMKQDESAATTQPSRLPLQPVDRTTRVQKRLTSKFENGEKSLKQKHVTGKELGMTFLESTGGALQETSQSVQEISNAMRRLQGNLWSLASTGVIAWQRVPNSQRVPRDVYEKYKRERSG